MKFLNAKVEAPVTVSVSLPSFKNPFKKNPDFIELNLLLEEMLKFSPVDNSAEARLTEARYAAFVLNLTIEYRELRSERDRKKLAKLVNKHMDLIIGQEVEDDFDWMSIDLA